MRRHNEAHTVAAATSLSDVIRNFVAYYLLLSRGCLPLQSSQQNDGNGNKGGGDKGMKSVRERKRGNNIGEKRPKIEFH